MKIQKMHTGRNFSKKHFTNLKIPKIVGINFTNAAKIIKTQNPPKAIKVLYKQARSQEFFRAGEVSWNRNSFISLLLQQKAPAGNKSVRFLFI